MLEARGSDLAVEDLTVRNAAVANIAGENANLVVERASILGSSEDGSAAPGGSNIEVSGARSSCEHLLSGPSIGNEVTVSISVEDGADVFVTGSYLQGQYLLYVSQGIGGNGTVRVEDTTIAGHLGELRLR